MHGMKYVSIHSIRNQQSLITVFQTYSMKVNSKEITKILRILRICGLCLNEQ